MRVGITQENGEWYISNASKVRIEVEGAMIDLETLIDRLIENNRVTQERLDDLELRILATDR